jgi:hypothetical protein
MLTRSAARSPVGGATRTVSALTYGVVNGSEACVACAINPTEATAIPMMSSLRIVASVRVSECWHAVQAV